MESSFSVRLFLLPISLLHRISFFAPTYIGTFPILWRNTRMGGDDEKDRTSADEIASPLAVVIAAGSAVCGSSGRSPEVPINDGKEGFAMVAGEAENVVAGGRQAKRECWAVDLESGEGCRKSESEEAFICRICHLDPSPICSGAEGLELIVLGCGCKGDMGIAHRHCAVAWFTAKDSWCCEICGLFAENIVHKEYRRRFMEARHARRSSSSDSDDPFDSHAIFVEWSNVELFTCVLSSILLLALFCSLFEMGATHP